MKEEKRKIIHLTERQLSKVLHLKENKEILLEYLITRSDFVEGAKNLVQQIIENWCLIRYCTLTNWNRPKTHWKTELKAHISNIGRGNIKGKNSIEIRTKAIAQGFEEGGVTEDAGVILKKISDKFSKEGIDVKSPIVSQVASDCASQYGTIISAIAEYQTINLNLYVDSI